LFFYRFCATLRTRLFARLSFFAFDLSHDNAKLKTLMSIWFFLFFFPASSRFANAATNEVDVDERALMPRRSILLIAVISARVTRPCNDENAKENSSVGRCCCSD